MKSNDDYDAAMVKLPERRFGMTPELMRRVAERGGLDVDKAIADHSAIDWVHDMIWAQAECLAHGLSDAQKSVLVARLRIRNEEFWKEHSRTPDWPGPVKD